MLRSKVLAAFEKADAHSELISSGLLNFVIVGAQGLPVQKLAGALADLFYKTLPKEFPDIPYIGTTSYNTSIDHGSSPLKEFSAEGQAYAAQILQERGVNLKLGVLVKEVQGDKVLLSDGSLLLSKTVIWAGGLVASPLTGIEKGHSGRIDIFHMIFLSVIFLQFLLSGDFARYLFKNGEYFLPQLASVAVQACGTHAAKNILADCQGKPRQPFTYRDKGIMAMIGRNAAIAEIGKKRHLVKGSLAFLAWLGVHVALLPSARQRVEAFFEWGWNYFINASPFQVIDKK